MTTGGPPPGGRTLAQLIAAAAGAKCSFCKAEPQVPCTWPEDKYHVARFRGLGMTGFERRQVEASARVDPARSGPKASLVSELPLYRPELVAEPEPELEAE
jgi:hypothetical protein